MQLWELASPTFAEQTSRLETQGRVVAILILKTIWKQNSFFLRGPKLFLLRPLTNWIRHALIMEDSLLYYLFQCRLHLKNTFTATSGHYSLAKLTIKINHHRTVAFILFLLFMYSKTFTELYPRHFPKYSGHRTEQS